MFKLKRVELDDYGQVAVKAIKFKAPDLTKEHLQKIIGRLYSKLLKENKLDDVSMKALEN